MNKLITIIIYGLSISLIISCMFFIFVFIKMYLYCEPSISDCKNDMNIKASITELAIYGIIIAICSLIILIFTVLKCFNNSGKGNLCNCLFNRNERYFEERIPIYLKQSNI